ncbi:hypothetical protein SAMN04487996_106217 [Dyadobacter soli]|uniref:Fibronectin type-III domain-containing protein n=1 Tax=Dyadobacter soli TaxID=659014 RepID=A0A1G7EZL2_9BACT|nr:hypothetical protein [Dyadobacter soli]SDE69007.1 hypothetical protein SAMN04487996_106217 [Dyadobacter soli]
MQKSISLLIIVCIAFLVEACSMFAPVDPLTPAASEVSVEQVWTSGATVRGKIDNLDPKNDRQEKKSGKILEYGFVWGTQNQPTIEAGTVIKVGEDNPPTPFEFVREINRLDVLTTYYVRTYAKNQGGGVGYGPVATFKTDDYVFAELSIGKITTTSKASADVVVNVLSLGNAEISSFGVCYSSTNNEPTTKDSRATANGKAVKGSFTVNVGGLAAGTTYYARAYAITLGGIIYSDATTGFSLGEPAVFTPKKSFTMYYSNPYDLDMGELVSQVGSEDCNWYPYNAIAGIYPKNGARFAVLGKVNFDQVKYADLARANLSTNFINGSYTDTKANQLENGTVIAFVTNQGRYGKMLINAHGEDRTPGTAGGGDMEVTILTYDKQ